MIDPRQPEEWEVLSTTEIAAGASKSDHFPDRLSSALQELDIPHEIQTRIQENLKKSLATAMDVKKNGGSPVIVHLLTRRRRRTGRSGGNELGIASERNHPPPDAWNFFIVARKAHRFGPSLIELYLFTERSSAHPAPLETRGAG
jgi:hypothetical protein